MENSFYRNLKFPFEFDISFASWIKSDHLNIFRLEKTFLGENFESLLEQFGYRIFLINGIYIPPKYSGELVYKSSSRESDLSKILIKYGSRSSIKFWNSDETIKTRTIDVPYEASHSFSGEDVVGSNSDSIIVSNQSELQLVHEFEPQKASLINGKYFQSIQNDTDYPVYIIIVDLYDPEKNRITWKQALKDFKNYIV